MTKDEYGDLLAEIGGGLEIGLDSRHEREAAERSVLETHNREFWGLLCLGDALHHFYRGTLDLVGRKIAESALDEAQILMSQWHVVSFNRFAAAFDLMARGYYFEAMVLARDLWEIALSLAALRRTVVSVEELLASKASTSLEAEELSRKADQKVRRVLITDNGALSETAREAIRVFQGIANLATHKSKLHLGLNLSRMAKGHPTLLLPHFDLERAGAAHNIIYLGTWSVVSTLPYLDFAVSADGKWQTAYGKVQRAFREGPGRGPNPVVQAWPEIIQKVFEK